MRFVSTIQRLTDAMSDSRETSDPGRDARAFAFAFASGFVVLCESHRCRVWMYG